MSLEDRPEDPSVALALAADLAAGGELVDQGEFSVDLDRAWQTMREHQLAEPSIYACLLVEASVLAGAEGIEFQLDKRALAASFAASIAAAELEQLFGAMFVDLAPLADDAARRQVRARQQLAIAINGALAAGAREVELESRDESGAGARLRVRIDDGGEQVEVEALEPADGSVPGTRFCAHFRRGKRPEPAVLRERCRCSSQTVLLDAETISHGPIAAFDGALELGFCDDSRAIQDDAGAWIGRAMVQATDEPARLELLTNGWFVERIPLDDCVPGFVACVDVDLRRDLSQTKVVRGPAYEAVLAAVLRSHDQLAQKQSLAKKPEELARIESAMQRAGEGERIGPTILMIAGGITGLTAPFLGPIGLLVTFVAFCLVGGGLALRSAKR